MMKEKKKLIEVMPSLLTDGAIFKHIPLFGEVTAVEMGISYSLRHSGQKYVNSLVENYIDSTGTVNETGIETIGNILKLVYGNNWTRIYDALMSEYNPIHNYSMTEKGTDIKTGTDSTNSSIGEQTITNDFGASVETHNLGQESITDVHGAKTTTENIGAVSNTDIHGPLERTEVHGDEAETHTYGEKETTDTLGNQSETTTTETNGLNDGWVNEDRNIVSKDSVTNTSIEGERSDSVTKDAVTDTISEQERTITHDEQARTNSISEETYTDTHEEAARTNTIENAEKTDTQTNGSREDKSVTTYDTTNTHEFSRDGNIGVTTTQQMIQSEIDLRTYNFYEQIFADIDKYICLSVY